MGTFGSAVVLWCWWRKAVGLRSVSPSWPWSLLQVGPKRPDGLFNRRIRGPSVGTRWRWLGPESEWAVRRRDDGVGKWGLDADRRPGGPTAARDVVVSIGASPRLARGSTGLRSRRRGLSLRVRIALLVVAAVLPTGVLIHRQGVAWKASAERDAAAQVERLAESAAAHQDTLVASAGLLVQALSSTTHVTDGSRCATELASIHDGLPQFGVLGVADASGQLWCTSREADVAVSVADRDYFRQVRTTSAPAVGGYQIGRVSGKPTVALAHPVLDRDGGFAGAVVASIDLSRPALLAERLALPEGSTVTVYDNAGTVLMRWPAGEGFVGQQMPAQVRAHQDGGTVRLAGLDGVERIYGVAELASGHGDVVLTVGVPVAVAESEVAARLRSAWLWLAVITAVSGLAALTTGQALVVRPVRRLQHAARRLSQGDLTARAASVRGGGELGELAQDFDAMATALQVREVELRRAEQRAVEERYLGLLDVTADGVIVTAADGCVVVFNRGAEAMFGVSSAAAVGVPVTDVVGSDVDLTTRSELQLSDATGAHRWVQTTASPGADGRTTLILRDVTAEREQQAELKRSNSELEVKALLDPLTGLANRSLLYDRLDAMLSRRHRAGVVVVFLDLDGFKAVNDTFGHAMGDAVLIEISRKLQSTTRTGDVVARLGGDEFVIAGGATDQAAARQLAQRVVDAVATSDVAGVDAVSASVGVAWVAPGDHSDAATAIAAADAAMLDAKRAGKGTVAFAATGRTVTTSTH